MLKSLSWEDRLNIERKLVYEELYQFSFYKEFNSAGFIGWQKSSNGLNDHQLELKLSWNYPDSMPTLIVKSPKYLSMHLNRGTINAEGYSHDFHTLTPDSQSHIKICHYNTESWDASKTCAGVLMKGIWWLKAYEEHYLTGKTINQILKEWKTQNLNSQILNIAYKI